MAIRIYGATSSGNCLKIKYAADHLALPYGGNAELQSRDFIAGNQISIADISLLAHRRVTHEGGYELTPRVNLLKWIARCEAKVNL